MENVPQFRMINYKFNETYKPRPSSWLRIILGTSLTTLWGYTVGYSLRIIKNEGKNFPKLWMKYSFLGSLTYYSVHEAVFYYLNNYSDLTDNFWITHSITGLICYNLANKYTFRMKMGYLRSTQIQLLTFMVLNGFIALHISRKQEYLTIPREQYRKYKRNVKLTIDGIEMLKEYEPEEIQHIAEWNKEIQRNVGLALNTVIRKRKDKLKEKRKKKVEVV